MISQIVVDNTRQRTRNAWVQAGRSTLPTAALDLIAVLVQRIEDLEEALGYTTDKSATAVLNAMDTQGR